MCDFSVMKKYYTDNYAEAAAIPDDRAVIWLKRAKAQLSRITAGKSDSNTTEAVKRCICELAELMYSYGRHEGIVSENNDGYSVKFENGDIKSKIMDIAVMYLSGTDILYRGDVCDM